MASILVVDDSPLDQRLVSGLLSRSVDLEVQQAESGDAALEFLQNNSVDMVLTDLIMPGIDGLELTAAIVEKYANVPVVLMTGQGSEEIAVRALKAGASSYVPKSSLSELLLETVQNILAVAAEQRGEEKLMQHLTRQQCQFHLGNDSTVIPALINFLGRSLRCVGLCDETNGIRVCVALEEALNNAVFHGNLEISSEMRDQDLGGYRELVEKRRGESPYRERSVHVSATITTESATFIIRDEGPGFDPNDLPDPTDPANLEKPSGRGLLLMKTFMDDIQFNSDGNEVTMTKLKD